MFDRVLKRMRERIQSRQYVMTLHAEEEMDAYGLTIYDVERGILSGKVLRRQRDELTREWKYRIRGRTIDGIEVEVIAKLGPTGKLVVLTVYLPEE